MKVLKVLGIIILVIVLIGLGIVVFGPSSGGMERSITINAPAEVVFAEVSNMKSFNKWSPWFSMDPDADYSWEGPFSGVGAKQVWFSDDKNVGNGYMEIVESTPNSFVKLDMGFDQNNNRDFTDEGNEKPVASFILEEDEAGTKVTWTFNISGVSGFSKFMVLGLDMFLGSFYEDGLESLKSRVEGRPDFSVAISDETLDPISFIGTSVSTSTAPEEMTAAMSGAYGKLMGYVQANNLEMTGYPLAVYTSFSEEKIDAICGVPVAEGTTVDSEELSLQQSQGGAVVMAVHRGDYANLKSTHEQIDQYIKHAGYEVAGPPWESYPTDPTVETDTAKWVTNVYYPVK